MNTYSDSAPRPRTKAEPSAAPWAVQAGLPLMAGISVWVLAIYQVDPAAAAESRFLAILIGGVLSAAATLSRELTWATGVGSVLAPLIAWAVPHGPHRGAAICLMLAALLVLAAARRRSRGKPLLDLPGSIALCLGSQLLTRSDLVLAAPDSTRALAVLLASALGAALALSLLAARHGERRALYLAAATLLLGAGWTMTGGAVLLALAAGSWLVPAPDRRWWAVAGLLPILLLNPLLGALASAAALCLVGGWWRLAPLLAIAGLALAAPPEPISAVASCALGLALVPTLLFAQRQHYGQLAAAIGLCWAAAGIPGELALLPGVGLALLALPDLGVGARLQSVWLLFAGFCGTLLAAYPWLAEQPLPRALALVGVASEPRSVMVLILSTTALGALLNRLDLDQNPLSERLVWLALALALGLQLPSVSQVPLQYQAVALADSAPWQAALDHSSVGEISIDCNLVNGAGLKVGTPVLQVMLFGPDQGTVASWTLSSGRDTAEWAAGRPDVAALPGFQAPRPWLAYVAPEGRFFGYRYRARLAALQTQQASRLEVRRAAELPPEVTPVIYRVELRP